MLSYLQQFVNNLNKPKYYLILANFLLVLFLVWFSNIGFLPMKLGDFLFFSFLYLIFALYRPGWSFLFFVGTITLESINLAPESLGIAVRPFQIIGALTILALLVRYLTKRINFEFVKLKWFDYLVGLFIFAGFLSSFFAISKGTALKQSVILLSFAVLYWLVRNYIQTLEDLKRIAPFFLGSSIIVVFYGIWQNILFLRGSNSFEVMPGRPNATFMEADWLGIFLVILIAVIYTIIYQIFNFQFSILKQFPNSNFQNLKYKKYIIPAALYLILVLVFILLILTVSRSAWLGAGFITLVFLKAMFTNFSFHPKDWQGKELFKHLGFVAGSVILSLGIVCVFHLTNFQLFNRTQSIGSGLQKITVACDLTKSDFVRLPEKIENVSELEQYGCRHINLEDINQEREAGFEIREIYRTDPNVNIRSQIYQKSIEQIKAHPIFGIGWGNIGKILGTDERGSSLNSSNIFLEVWLGSGILGLLAFLVILIYILVKSIIYCVKDDFESKIIGLFMVLGFFGFLIPNLFNAGIFLGIWWIYLGIGLNLKTEKI